MIDGRLLDRVELVFDTFSRSITDVLAFIFHLMKVTEGGDLWVEMASFRDLIRQAGVPAGRGRVLAIRQLLRTMPPPVVAKALGYHQFSATHIASQTGSTWSGYAAGDHTDSHNPRPAPL